MDGDTVVHTVFLDLLTRELSLRLTQIHKRDRIPRLSEPDTVPASASTDVKDMRRVVGIAGREMGVELLDSALSLQSVEKVPVEALPLLFTVLVVVRFGIGPIRMYHV